MTPAELGIFLEDKLSVLYSEDKLLYKSRLIPGKIAFLRQQIQDKRAHIIESQIVFQSHADKAVFTKELEEVLYSVGLVVFVL
jgi:hypothetical protein